MRRGWIGCAALWLVACGEVPTCGNGRLEVFESCDDGNERAGDGCDALCNIENGPRVKNAACVVDFEAFCPVDTPICGVTEAGGICVGKRQVGCHFFGEGALAVVPGIYPTTLEFGRDVSRVSVYFARIGDARGVMRFLDADGAQVLAFRTISSCDEGAPGPVTVQLSRPARRAEVLALGGPVFVDDLVLDAP